METEEFDEIEFDDEESGLEELGNLKMSAPENTFERLRKRVQMAQVGKDLVEKQAFAFWTVIDTFLRLLFVPNKKSEEIVENTKNIENTGDKK